MGPFPRDAVSICRRIVQYMALDTVLANFKWLQDYWLPYEMSGRAVHFGIGVLDHGATDYMLRWWSVPSPGVKDDFNLAYEGRKFFYLQHHMGKM